MSDDVAGAGARGALVGVKEVQGSGGYGMLIGPASTAEEREASS